MARAATSPELALFRAAGLWSKPRAAIIQPQIVYTARINQTFSTLDKVLELTYDGGSGTLANVLPDMTVLVGSSAGAHDVGIVRLRDKDADTFFIGETSDVRFANDLYLTIINDFGLWARQVLIDDGEPFMDGGVEYSDQHTNFDPVPIMGGHRILELTGDDISTTFDFSDSYCPGSSISAYSCSAPTATSVTNGTTSTPTVTFDTVGSHAVYLTLTAANGKTFFGMRWVHVWNADNPPPGAQIGDCRVDSDTGGWTFEITLFDETDLDAIRDRALVILFAEDYYGDTKQSIGPVEGCENVLVSGWISRESINWNPEVGRVRFTVHGAHYWFQQIPAWPDGVKFTTAIPSTWTEIQNLTVDLGLYHFLRWRTTATRMMDCFLTGNTLYTKEVSSLAQNLWEQIREMTALQLFARPGVNAHGQLYVEVHPQLVPEADRDWPTVMTILKKDWRDDIELERVIVRPVAIVNLSGVSVNSSGKGTSFFSLATGHSHPRYGKIENQDHLLVESQAQANSLAGLYYGWSNNEFPDIPIVLYANNRLIDCFPRQQCAITIEETDTPRGIAYSGNIIPTSVAYVQDPDTGYLHTEATFQAETFEALSVNGDVPGSGDVSVPPVSSLPPIPPFPVLIPGTSEPTATGPLVILHDLGGGFIYAPLGTTNPQWITMNAGITPPVKYQNANFCFVCPNGSVYIGRCSALQNADRGIDYFGAPWIARAPSVGGTFVILEDEDTLWTKYPEHPTLNHAIKGIAYNPLVPELVAYIIGQNTSTLDTSDFNFYLGAGSSFAEGVNITNIADSLGFIGFSYGLNKWVYTGAKAQIFNPSARWTFNVAGSAIDSQADVGDISEAAHVRAGTTGTIYLQGLITGDIRKSLDNGASWNLIGNTLLHAGLGLSVDPSGMLAMLRFDTGAKGKSSDGLATVSPLPSLPPGPWWFGYAGGAGASSRWVAAGGSSVRLSENFGTTWLNREGNLQQVIPIPNIDMVRVVSY